jgi:DNA-binding NarL/FixJ family response regulator
MVLGWRTCEHATVLATVLIVDDHPEFRAVARRLLEAGGFDVVGDAADGSSATAAVQELHPDVVLLDIQLPDVSGLELCRRLTAPADAPRVVLVSSRDAADYGLRLGRCGALGFVAKADLSVVTLEAVLHARPPSA